MDRRTTFALLIFLALLLVAAGVIQGWFVQGASRIVGHPLVPPTATSTPSVQNLWSFDSTKAVSVEISDLAQAKNVVLQRQKDGTWQITAPQVEAADTGTVESAVSQVSSLSIVTNLGLGLQASIFGIDKPHYELTLKTSTDTHILEIGSATPTGSGYYVREKGDSRILIVNKTSLDSVIAFLSQLPLPATPTPAESATPTVAPSATPAETGMATAPPPAVTGTPEVSPTAP
jgi:hypothetical protein